MTATEQGRQAFLQGKLATANPFPNDKWDEQHWDWHSGWAGERRAHAMRELNDAGDAVLAALRAA